MTITEAGACGTPAVATRVVGQVDTVDSGVTGLLAGDEEELVGALGTILSDEGLRLKLSKGALARAESLTWDSTARHTLQVVASEVARSNGIAVDPAILRFGNPSKGVASRQGGVSCDGSGPPVVHAQPLESGNGLATRETVGTVARDVDAETGDVLAGLAGGRSEQP